MEVVDVINTIHGYHPSVVFRDWVELTAMAFTHNDEQYLRIASKYPNDINKFPVMTAMLAMMFEDRLDDHLGKIYMECANSNSRTGQFFTPFHLSELVAGLTLNEDVNLCEPSCGSGGMIIAAAKTLQDRGINYQQKMHVTAYDVDLTCVYMCYIQMQLLGIDATVAQRNALSIDQIGEVFRTI